MCNYQFIPSGGFMQLITPLAHRWRKVEMDAGYCSISTYIEKPVPLLEVFDLSSAPISPDFIFFGGVHPVLSNVRLSDVVLPNDTGFLRNLRVLCLKLISGPSGKLHLSVLRAILADSPSLEQLVLDAHYLSDTQPPQPILLPYLTSFQLTASVLRPRCPTAVSTMIHAPNVTHLDLCFDGLPAPLDLNLSSTLKVERLRQPSNLAIEISPRGFNLSTEMQSEAQCASQGVFAAISHYTREMEVAVSLLRYIGSITSPLVPIDLVVHEEAIEGVLNYLKSSQEVEVGYHLPGLRTVYLDSVLWNSYPYKQIVADLARARQDITICRRTRSRFGSDQPFLG
ncbi:hypothetical protein FS837_005524 [Tulasnella sp. UAMH 9824]|nr:hypothetical protein FS837_005524 [Tulasnella sp. UAMH 9824]